MFLVISEDHMTNIFNVGGARVGVQVLPKPNIYLTGTTPAVQVRYQGHFLLVLSMVDSWPPQYCVCNSKLHSRGDFVRGSAGICFLLHNTSLSKKLDNSPDCHGI